MPKHSPVGTDADLHCTCGADLGHFVHGQDANDAFLVHATEDPELESLHQILIEADEENDEVPDDLIPMLEYGRDKLKQHGWRYHYPE